MQPILCALCAMELFAECQPFRAYQRAAPSFLSMRGATTTPAGSAYTMTLVPHENLAWPMPLPHAAGPDLPTTKQPAG